MAFAAVVSLVAATKPSIEAAPASAPLPSHHDQRGRHSRRTHSRTMAARALRMPATANAGQAIHLIKRPPVLQSTAQSTRRIAARLRATMTDALLSLEQASQGSLCAVIFGGAYTLVGCLAHDPAEECAGVAARDFLDVCIGVAPLDQTTDDVLAIRG